MVGVIGLSKKYIIITVVLVCFLGILIGGWLTNDFLNNGFSGKIKAQKVSRPVSIGFSLNYSGIKSI